MAHKTHRYTAHVTWSGNLGEGTSGYKAYGRNHEISAGSKPPIPGSADTAFRGDAARWNPEDLLVSSLSTCHLLWYLHLCAVSGVVVLAYEDDAEGAMEQTADGGGHFVQVTLRPRVTVAQGADLELAQALHEKAHGLCFVANSVNFPVSHEAVVTEAD